MTEDADRLTWTETTLVDPGVDLLALLFQLFHIYAEV